MAAATPSPANVLAAVAELGPPGTPVTTPEVAGRFDCTSRTIYNKLDALADDDVLETKKVGANSRVWWRPVSGDAGRNGGASGLDTPVSLHGGRSLDCYADGEIAERIREFEWAETPLGPTTEWPQALRVAVDVLLGADEAIGVYWGRDLTLLYNDAWRELIGEKHPAALGRPASLVFPEIWETIEPTFERVRSGAGAEANREQRLPLDRGAGLEDAWFDYSFNPIPVADGSIGGVFNVAVEVTERKQRERKLLEQRESIEAILAHTPGILFNFDENGVFTRSRGRPLRTIGLEAEEAVGQSVFDLYADHPAILGICRRALAGETVSDIVTVGERTFEATCQPVVDEDGDVTQVVGFAYDVTDQKARERSLERVEQLTGSLRPLNRALTQATTRDEIERVVCDELAASDAYRLAWYGDYAPDREHVLPQTWTGIDDGSLDALDVATDGTSTGWGPVGRAVRTRDVQAARDVSTDPTFAPWREAARVYGYRSAAVVPVGFDETVYGVIGVCSERADAFDAYERGLLRELGDRIGYAIRAVENERLLLTDTVVELEFQTGSTESVFVRTTAELGCRMELETVAPASESAFLCYATVDGTAPKAFVELLAGSSEIEHARVVSAAGFGGTVEYRVRSSPMTKLLDYGVVVTSHIVDDGDETLVGEVAPDADARAIISGVRAAYSDTTFVAKRSVDRPVRSVTVTRNALDDVLTDRQREVLDLAYHAGFFESPRRSTGDELADALDISSPTFYLHARKATQKLLSRIDEIGLFG